MKYKFYRQLLPVLISLFFCLAVSAQETAPRQQLGSLEVPGRVKIGGKPAKLERKRFYLFRGGLAENKALVEKLKSSELISRDCFYNRIKSSPQFICWLKTNNCESPYCRDISMDDIGRVPEFQAAYQKGLRQYRRPEIARQWLTTNLLPELRQGFYLQQRSALAMLLGDLKPMQSSMTDVTNVSALFIDIPLNLSGEKKSETFLISNILPIERGGKSYVWVCQKSVRAFKQEKLILADPENNKTVKDCEVIVKDLPVCAAESCPQ